MSDPKMDDTGPFLETVRSRSGEGDGGASQAKDGLAESRGVRAEPTSTALWEIAATGAAGMQPATDRASRLETPPSQPIACGDEADVSATGARRPSIAAYTMDRTGPNALQARRRPSNDLTPDSPLLDLPASWRNRHATPHADQQAPRDLVVGYSRRSSARDSESIDRQIDGQVVYAESKGDVIGRSFVDRGVSGATLIGRQGLLRIVEMAKRGEIGKVLVDDVSRIARSMSILASFYEELTELGVEIHSVRKGGRLDLIDICIRGYMSVEERASIMRHCLDGRLRMAGRGRWPTGAFFGYEAVPGEPGLLRIHPAQANIVRSMFTLVLAGASCRMIADILNAEKVPSPRLKRWRGTAINQMLRNPLYDGIMAFGRRRYYRNLRTGKRWNVAVPMGDWTPSRAPELRIVPNEIFAAVQDKFSGNRAVKRGTRRTYLLSERLICPACGGTMGPRSSRKRATLIRCHAALDDRAACDHARLYPMAEIETATLNLVRPLLGGDEHQAEFLAELDSSRSESRQSWEARRIEAEQRVSRLRGALLATLKNTGLASEANPAHVALAVGEISRELDEAEDVVAHCRSESRRFTPFDDRLRATLRDAFDDVIRMSPFRPVDDAGQHLFAAFRDLIERVEILPIPGSRAVGLRVHVRLRQLLGIEEGEDAACTVLTGTCEVDRHLQRRANVHASELAALVRDGHLFMTDEVWAIAEPTFRRYAPRGALKGISRRKILDVVVCCRRIGLPFGQLPSDILGTSGRQLNRAVYHMAFTGHWARIVAALRVGAPSFLAGVEVDFATRRKPNHRIQRPIEPQPRKRRNAVPLRVQPFILDLLAAHEGMSTAEIDRAVQARGWSVWSSQKGRAALLARGLVVKHVKIWSLTLPST